MYDIVIYSIKDLYGAIKQIWNSVHNSTVNNMKIENKFYWTVKRKMYEEYPRNAFILDQPTIYDDP